MAHVYAWQPRRKEPNVHATVGFNGGSKRVTPRGCTTSKRLIHRPGAFRNGFCGKNRGFHYFVKLGFANVMFAFGSMDEC